MQLAKNALITAYWEGDYALAERYYQSAMENSKAIVDAPLRERLTRPAAVRRVCLLAQRGELDEAERFAAPIMAAVEADYRQTPRMKDGGERWLWICTGFAQRMQGRYDDAVRTMQTFLERCLALGLDVKESARSVYRGSPSRRWRNSMRDDLPRRSPRCSGRRTWKS